MRIVLTVFMTVFSHSALAQQASPPQPAAPAVEFNVEVLGSKVAEFTMKMDAYGALRRSLEIGLPPLAVTDNPSEIVRAEKLLAERIRRARAGTSRGDIFNQETRRAFRQLLLDRIDEAIRCER